jgi:hypothetical protein
MVEVRAHLNRLLQADLPDDLLADPDRGESAATDAESTDAEPTEAC